MNRVVLLLFLLPLSAFATNFTVKAGGGGNFTTIQACATAMANGDTCTVFAGTYNESPSIPSGGTGGLYKTITVNGSDVVTVKGFTIASHDKIIGNCPALQGTVTTATCGFFITNPSSPTTSCLSVASASTDSYFSGNAMYACGTISFAQSASHNTNIYFTGNTLSYPGSTSSAPNTMEGISVHCDGCLFENNDISHTADAITEIDGNNNVIRKNVFHDNLQSECGSNSNNCHIDFVASEPNVGGGGYATNHNLIESNSDYNCNDSLGCHEWLVQADVCSGQCTDAIVRFNNAAHIYSAGLQNDSGWAGVYNYNNTEVDVATAFGGTGNNQIADTCSNSATDCQYINNLYYYLGTITNFNAIGVSGGTLTSATHNLAWCTDGSSNCPLWGTTYNSGTWTGSGQIMSNPLLANPSTSGTALGDNRLLAGSPALNGGTNLTTVNGAVTSSTTLVVADAGFFQANAGGISGVSADCIAIGTVSNTACISSINYATNTLTLATPITAANSAPVWLYSDSSGNVQLTGTAPNIGALGAVGGISYIGGCSAATTSCTPTTHAVNDLIVAWAFRNGSSTAPTLPSGWTSVATNSVGTSGSSRSAELTACKVATSTTDGNDVFTNATALTIVIYRNANVTGARSCGAVGIPAKASSTGTTTLNYPALTLTEDGGASTSWVTGFIGTSAASTNALNAPSGMANRQTVTNAAAAADTGAGVASWTSTNVTGGTSVRYLSTTVEINAALFSFTLSSSGAGSGTFSGTNCASGSYVSGTAITCSATPASGSTFAGWTGTGSASTCSGTGSCAFTLTTNSTATATFTRNATSVAGVGVVGVVN